MGAPAYHARTHSPGGTDPIPGLGPGPWKTLTYENDWDDEDPDCPFRYRWQWAGLSSVDESGLEFEGNVAGGTSGTVVGTFPAEDRFSCDKGPTPIGMMVDGERVVGEFEILTTGELIIYFPVGGGGGAPDNAQYVTLATDGTLTDERVLTAGAGVTLTDAGAGSTITVASPSDAYICIVDEKTANTSGGTFTSGAWRTRDLNTERSDTGSHASVSSNQITLDAGTYRCRWSAPGYEVERHKTKLRNVTDSSDVLIGSSEFAQIGSGGLSWQTTSVGMGRFTIASSKTFELQHQCKTTRSTYGFGVESNFGVVEVYAQIEFWKEA